jgi:hypothetical protein
VVVSVDVQIQQLLDGVLLKAFQRHFFFYVVVNVFVVDLKKGLFAQEKELCQQVKDDDLTVN